MTTVKDICLGVAVAGVVAGAGTVVGTAVAYAEESGSDSQSTSDAKDKPAAKNSLGPKKKLTSQVKVRSDVPKLSKRMADAVEAARQTKDAPLNRASDNLSRAGKSITDVSTNLRRTVGIRIAKNDVARPVVSRNAVKAVTQFLAALPAPQKPSSPSPLLPMALAGANTSVTTTTRNSATGTTTTQAVQTAAAPTQHVLVIGVDGTNLSRVLEDPETNDNFIRLMNTGTTSAASIAGHTTISNPSWTAILTGVWDTKSGVINNVFTPDTYDEWPTVFDQLEGANPAIRTKVVADWDVIADIGNAGTYGADDVEYIPQIEGDTDWSATDAEVTAQSINAILGVDGEPIPNFMFTYLVQVDEAGHAYGGDSQEYADAIARTDENLGDILDAVAAREAASCAAGACEDWTVIVVTDHGHQPQKGVGHGFQSPRETSTFVIVDGPGYGNAEMNNGYEIVDVTPTVVSMFGIDPRSDSDGVPLQDQGATQVDPADLQAALEQQIASYGWPSPGITIKLSVRTVFGTIPYLVVGATNDATAALEDIQNQNIILISPLAGIAVIPVQIIGDGAYAVTNAVAQVVARLTGAGVIPPSASVVQVSRVPQVAVAV